jgi:Carbon-nitrogen hydrolase
MANELTLSVLSDRPTQGLGGVEDVCAFWRERIGRVLADRPDLIVLPEACEMAVGALTLEEHLADCGTRDARLLMCFADLAKEHRCWITLPTYRKDGEGRHRNSVRLIDRSGEVAGVYDKTYPTIEEIEAGVVPGGEPEVIDTEFGRAACLICFDLNFEELRRHYAAQRPDLILFCSMYHGGHAQQAWAYRCRAHLVSAISQLPSGVMSPVGEVLATTTNYTPCSTTRVNLDCCVAHLDLNAQKLSALKQKYGPEVDIHDPGLLGSVLITSRSKDHSARQMAEKSGIELIDDYLDRSLEVRRKALGSRP